MVFFYPFSHDIFSFIELQIESSWTTACLIVFFIVTHSKHKWCASRALAEGDSWKLCKMCQ